MLLLPQWGDNIKKRTSRYKNKSKKKYFIVIFFFLIFSFSYFFTFSLLKSNISNEEFIRILLSEENHSTNSKYSKTNLFIKVSSIISQIDFTKPFTIIKNNYVFKDKSNNASDDKEPTNKTSKYVNDPYPDKENTNPIVYIYNTHQLEEYLKENTESYSVTPNVMMASYILREKLANYNISSLVEENNVSEILKMNNWNYASSYKVTRMLLEDAKSKNPTLKYFIDLHRDSVSKKISTTTINNKSYAKVLFIVGMENPNYQKNLNLTNRLQTLFESKYKGLSRGIYKKQGAGVNGVYNQDFNENTILIEVGGDQNTIYEVYNTIDAIADVLNEIIGGNG